MPILSIDYAIQPSVRAAFSTPGIGYEDNSLVAGEIRKSDLRSFPMTDIPEHLAHSVAGIGMVVNAVGGTVCVADVGGSSGGHYGLATQAFPAVRFIWTVLETPMYVEHGRKAVDNTDVSFTSDAATLGRVDLAYFSGVLQYVEDWRALLGHPKLLAADWILITRTPQTDEADAIGYVQTVVYDHTTVRYPGQVLPRAAIDDVVGKTHEFVASFQFVQISAGNLARPAPTLLFRRRGVGAGGSGGTKRPWWRFWKG